MERILQVLDAQWQRLATSPEAHRALIRWANDHEVLVGLDDLHDVVQCRRDPQIAEDVLLILARLSPTDEIAARSLLQMLLPGLVSLVGTVGRGDFEAQDELIALAWERIRTYPITRNGSVAANVVLDVRKRYLKLRLGEETIPLSRVPEPVDDPANSPEEQVLGLLLIEDIAAAQRDGLMSEAVLETIMRTRLGGERLATVAADQRVETHVLCQRRWRAERRLRSLPLAG
jgi:hypothetical protein